MIDTNIKYDLLQTETPATMMDFLNAAALPGETTFDTIDRLLGATLVDADYKMSANDYAAFLKALGSHAEPYQKLERDIVTESKL